MTSVRGNEGKTEGDRKRRTNMNSQYRRKVRAIALGSVLIVTQCCCCILPIRLRVEQNLPGMQASASLLIAKKTLCELMARPRGISAALVEAMPVSPQCDQAGASV